jgi:hypothetical protein
MDTRLPRTDNVSRSCRRGPNSSGPRRAQRLGYLPRREDGAPRWATEIAMLPIGSGGTLSPWRSVALRLFSVVKKFVLAVAAGDAWSRTGVAVRALSAGALESAWRPFDGPVRHAVKQEIFYPDFSRWPHILADRTGAIAVARVTRLRRQHDVMLRHRHGIASCDRAYARTTVTAAGPSACICVHLLKSAFDSFLSARGTPPQVWPPSRCMHTSPPPVWSSSRCAHALPPMDSNSNEISNLRTHHGAAA